MIVSIVRPPMIYGPGCPGNYVSLSKLARKTPIFPFVTNERSMLFIDNLSAFIYQVICHQDGGIFHPQDAAYMNTSQLVAEMAKQHGQRVFFSKVGGCVLTSLFSNVGVVNKVFGNLTYAKELSRYRDDCYQVVSFEEAVRLTERGV